jgi:hypothetical protein
MLMNQEPDGNIADLTDTEMYAAIRYLEPSPRSANEQDAHDQNKDDVVAICVCSFVALLVFLSIWWVY